MMHPERDLTPFQQGVLYEEKRLAQIAAAKNTTVWRPTVLDTESAAFKVIVGEPRYTPTGLLKGTIFDATEPRLLEIKGGTSPLDSSYQLRLEVYRSLKQDVPLTIETSRPVNPSFQDWLARWGVSVKKPG